MRSLALAALSLLVCAAPAAAEEASEVSEVSEIEAYQRARAAFTKEDYPEALQWLRHANALSPKAEYVYNMGRSLEEMGRLREAHDQFLLVKAQPDVSEDLKRLAQARVEALAPLRDRALLRWGTLGPGATAQIDAELIADATGERPLKAGRHQICVLSDAGARLRCWRRDLRAGFRADVPLSGARATIVWPAGADAKSLTLGGHRMLVDPAALKTIEVDPGSHQLGVELASGQARQIALSLLPDATHRLSLDAEEKPEGGGGPGPAGWIVGGVGVAAMGVGVALMLDAESQRVGLEDDLVRDADGVIISTTQVADAQAFEDADDQTLVGGVLMGAGAALALTGVILLATGGSEPATEPAVQVGVAPGGARALFRF